VGGVFLGEYQHSLDEKGRVVLPSKFRDELKDGCVITKGQERCLYVFPMEQWGHEVERVRSLPRTNRRNRNFARAFFAGAAEVTPDRNGRIAIPPGLREYAELDKDVAVVGVAERIEIWSVPVWEQISAEADDSYADIAETLAAEEGI